ncbi:family 78 glycoside hydrolase catalytic domain [Chitinophaga sp. ysch24]|uniref:alpha-L-rhamnosidase n=2 Tax=Chitinophaga tropicalis TaxID=2683588 RepID=A0A7K1UBY2_9BACT|nr:family 78 glycoside hydrolase catalytic domain [Chitinophaga tropicalis]
MLTNPQGIDVVTPRLSWEITGDVRNVAQQSYQVLVASSIQKLAADQGDIWNSGKVASSNSVHVTYAGKALGSGQQYYWKVKVWTTQGESKWSAPAQWSMGLLKPANWQAKWIGTDTSFTWDDAANKFSRLSARYYRKAFQVRKKIRRATAYVSGPGLYELYVNGQRIGRQVLAQSPTDYRRTVRYNTFDVTAALQQGENVVAAVTGNGYYFTMRQAYKPHKIRTFGYPRLLLQLDVELEDGSRVTIPSDSTWKLTADGPIRSNNIYDGEEYDASKEMPGWNKPGYNDKHWSYASLVPVPGGQLKAQMNELIRIVDSIRPVSVKRGNADTFLVDMGQNMAGWLQLKMKAPEQGSRVSVRFAETLQAGGQQLFTDNLRDAKATDLYLAKGGGNEIWSPSFVYHGFRYAAIAGYPGNPTEDDILGQVVSDDLPLSGSFETSDPTINSIYKNAWWGIRSNYKGLPVDCPQRNERMPWLGDRTTGAYGESFLFDNAKLYAKWLDDIEDAQTAEGAIPDVVPAYWNYASDNMTWPGAYLTIAGMLYHQFGDVQPVIRHYASMKRWIDYMGRKYLVDNIMTRDKYGDWCVPPESKQLIHTKDSTRKTDGTLLATAYYYHLLNMMKRFAVISGNVRDTAAFASRAEAVKDAFNRKFFHPETAGYSNNTVTANLLPLYFGMVPADKKQRVFDSMTACIMNKYGGHISTGVVGTQWLMRGLSRNGKPDLAYLIAADRDYPGWGYMVENGATTIWELWNGNTANPEMNSQNHVMLLGDLLIWCYEDLAGIRSSDEHPGFEELDMNPVLPSGLDHVNASFRSIRGLIRSSWRKTTDRFYWQISIPANTTAIVHIPAVAPAQVTESGKPVNKDITFLRMESGRAVYRIGSGNYTFESVLQRPWKKGIVTDEFIFDKAPFPESHAATIAGTPQGLVAAWFGGTKERNPDVGIWVSRRVNNQWTAPIEVANGIVNDTVRYACWNPVLYQAPGGDLLLFYKVGPKVAGWKGWLKTSKDGGITWSAAQALPDGFLGPVKNKPVLLDNGELLCPSSTEGGRWKAHFEYSTDSGKTWKMRGPINDTFFNVIQPSILKYGNKRLQILCRSKEGNIIQSWSDDNGRTWSSLSATALPNNNSGTDAVTLADGRQLLVYNHVKTPKGKSKGARTPLNVAISEDGINWMAALILEDSPVSQYSYPSVIQSADGYVHIVYTWRRQRIKYVKIDPRLLELKPIKNEQWP